MGEPVAPSAAVPRRSPVPRGSSASRNGGHASSRIRGECAATWHASRWAKCAAATGSSTLGPATPSARARRFAGFRWTASARGRERAPPAAPVSGPSAAGTSRVGPARARRRRGGTVEPGEHAYAEGLADRTNRLGAETVGADASDPPVLFLETEDHLQRLAPPTCREQQHDRLALEIDALDVHGVGPGLRRPLLVAVDHLIEELGGALGGVAAADVERVADVLPRATVEHEADQARDVLGGVQLDEPVEELRG